MFEIRVPAMGVDAGEVTLQEWLVKTGDAITKDQAIARLSTREHRFLLRTSRAGIVSAVLAKPKSVLPKGSVLCLLDASARDVQEAKSENEDRFQRHLQADTIVLGREEEEAAGMPTRSHAPVTPTPGALRLANEHGLSLPLIAQTMQVEGVLREEHVRAYLERDSR